MRSLLQDPLFLCINLKTSIERRDRMRAMASAHGVDLHFVEAIAAADVETEQPSRRYDALFRRRRFATDLTPAEQACVHSHAKALEMFLASDARHAVIFEDNARFLDGFSDFFANLDLESASFDLIRLETRKRSKVNLRAFRHKNFRLLYSPRISAGAVGIIYSRRGAENVLRSLRNFYLAYDTHLGMFWSYGLEILVVEPAIVERVPRHQLASTIDAQDRIIGADRRAENAVPALGVRWLLNRQQRWMHEVMKFVGAFRYYARARLVSPGRLPLLTVPAEQTVGIDGDRAGAQHVDDAARPRQSGM